MRGSYVRRFGLAAIAGVLSVAVGGQMTPPAGPAAGEICARLESQLAALERGGVDTARAEQIRRYEDAAGRQQYELDRIVIQARRMGCEGSGFFLFGSGQPPQCDQLNGQIQRMRANLDRIMADLQRLQRTPPEAEGQRRALLIALGENNCGPQYRTAAPPRPRGFFESLFGGILSPAPPPSAPGEWSPETTPASGTFRTLCVRTCDGFYFPISYATVPSRFPEDERTCQRLCPAAEVALYAHRNPGEDISQAVSTSGRPYTELPNAFRYRTEFNPACSCKRADESWAEALKNVGDRPEQGDIIVTEEQSRAMAQPRGEPRAAKQQQSRSKGMPKGPATAPTTDAETPPPSIEATASPTPPGGDGKRNVRIVGPPFLPTR